MAVFEWTRGALHAEGVDCCGFPVRFGTPLYVYSRAGIERAWREFSDALAGRPHRVCYAIKANSNLAVLDILARLGSGFDIVSVGELKRVLAAGGTADRIVFSGVGKRRDEIEYALEVGIHCFNVESVAELERLADIAAAHGVVAPLSLRINPDVDARTHPYISTGLKENKFGIGMGIALDTYRRAADMPSLRLTGIDCHIGSQLTSIDPYRDALQRLMDIVDALAADGIALGHVDVGGGQGITYQNEASMPIAEWAAAVVAGVGERALEIVVEPGRYIVGNNGILLTRIEYLKQNEDKHFAVVDAAMNDLIRPALYSAWQDIREVVSAGDGIVKTEYDVVGPVCESADFLGKQRHLAVAADDLLAVMSAGAYAFAMSSNYNSRPRAAEVMVDGETATLVRERETPESLFAGEHRLGADQLSTGR